MKILIKYATRGRPAKFRDAIRNIQNTITTKDYLIVVSIDSDDKAILEEIHKHRPSVHMAVYVGKPAGKIAAINRDLNHEFDGWDLLINFSDDMKFVVPGWDRIMINKIKGVWGESLDFFAHFSDGYVKDKLPTMSIMGREYYERFFYIYPPCYRSVSCDAEAMYVAMMLKRYHYFAEVLFKHEHPINLNIKGMKIDETYRVNGQYENADTQTYFERLNKNFYVNNPGPTPFDQYKKK